MRTGNNSGFKVYYLSERAVTIEFGQEISEVMLTQITAFNTTVNNHPFPGFITAVPAYSTVSIFYDPVMVITTESMHGVDCFEKVANYLQSLLTPISHHQNQTPVNLITIPTTYGGNFGPDLQEVAKINKLTVEEVIHLHSAATYKVYMIGFVPGFAYLGGMSELIESPRKATPRKAVPIGSVGIAGKQTGIYPIASPGGWQLIGKTPLILFDANRSQPSLLQAGDEVVFKPIDSHEFEFIANNRYADSHY